MHSYIPLAHVKVNVAVVIVVNECEAAYGSALDSRVRAYVFESSVFLVVQEQHTFKITNG